MEDTRRHLRSADHHDYYDDYHHDDHYFDYHHSTTDYYHHDDYHGALNYDCRAILDDDYYDACDFDYDDYDGAACDDDYDDDCAAGSGCGVGVEGCGGC